MKIKREKPKRSLSRRLVLAVDALMNHILLLLAALVFLFGFYALWDANQVYSQASSSEYEAYRPVSTSEKDELASFSGFHKLQQVNPEVLGWINVYGTNIDYPLVQAKDNEKYLNKDSKGEFAATGAIFLEARNESKFEDFNTIIYGHHVENGGMFGGGRQQQGPQKGNDLREDIDISFEDAAFGKSMEIEVHRHEECDHCHGTGGEPGSRVDTCPNCHGSGQEAVIQNTPFGRMQSVRTCSRCHGTGKSIEKPCSKCRGTGEMLAKRKISIKIPAGVDSGSRLRVANEGEPGILGGPKGDLYVYIFVRPHKEFERNGNDVISRVNISFAQAALGATIQVNTLDGKVELKIPEGTQTGTAFRVKGKGIPYLRNPNQRGDQHIVVTVQTPKKLTDTQRELLLRFANESNEDVNNLQVSKSLFEKIKDCLTK